MYINKIIGVLFFFAFGVSQAQITALNIKHLGPSQGEDILPHLYIMESVDTSETPQYKNAEYYMVGSVKDKVFEILINELIRLMDSKTYSQQNSTICEWGCTSFVLYNSNGYAERNYILHNSELTLRFMEELIVNCEKKLNSPDFRRVFYHFLNAYSAE